MKRTIKVRTFLGQAIDTFKEYIKTKGNLQIDYSLEEYMQEILDYIDYLEKENQDLKEQLEEYKNENKRLGQDKLEYLTKYGTILSSQDKFIKYLEDGIKSSSTLDTINKQTAMYIYSTTLRKYKETIGDNK